MLTKNSFLSLALLASTVSLSFACQKKQDAAGVTAAHDSQSNLWSSRSQAKPTQFWALIRLKTSPLLSNVDPHNFKASYKSFEKEAAQLLAEQDAFLKQAKEINSSIEVVLRYKWSLNAVLITGPIEALEKLQKISLVTTYDTDGIIERPKEINQATRLSAFTTSIKKFEKNSVKFTGADKLHSGDQPIDGTGVRVGVLDTGIDYTHKMFGGPGDKELIKSINPDTLNPYFPNKKVVGGIDIVGTEFNTRSSDIRKRIPKSDPNPIDEATHGTHVAGTIAGLGDGDNTYSGMAPGADLYAIKVFGAEGATTDSAVIQGFEYAVDPNGDLNPDDHLHVLNLSLGSSYGSAKTLYNEAILQLNRIGMVVVASAGNSGNIPYITGSPGATDGAFSVAANVDDSLKNWQVPTSKLTLGGTDFFVDRITADIGVAIDEKMSEAIELVDVGYADQPIPVELAEKVKGKIALIERGKIFFAKKFEFAQAAGAVAVIVMNDRAEPPFVMGGEGKFNIPGIMISQELGIKVRNLLKMNEKVVASLYSDKLNEYPERISQITSFSSRGPRADGLEIKPQITAPGEAIVSAGKGTGVEGVEMSGTSMAGPHVAGAMALLRSAFPALATHELQAIIMNQAEPVKKSNGDYEDIARQGAGSLRIDRAVFAKVVVEPAGIALGLVPVDQQKIVRRKLTIRNLQGREQELVIKMEQAPAHIKLRQVEQTVKLSADQKIDVNLDLVISSPKNDLFVTESNAWIVIQDKNEKIVARLPLLVFPQKVAKIEAPKLTLFSNSSDQVMALGQLELENKSSQTARLMPFNFLMRDSRKNFVQESPLIFSNHCDLEAAGFRLINGGKTLQLAAKMYRPISSWNFCEVVALIDADGDGVPEQELGAIDKSSVSGLVARGVEAKTYANVLFDAKKMRNIRAEAEQKASQGEAATPNYQGAVVSESPLNVLDHTTLVILEAPVEKLVRSPSGALKVQILAQNFDGYDLESDDFLGAPSDWLPISLEQESQSFIDLPALISVSPKSNVVLEITRGLGTAPLMLLNTTGLGIQSTVLADDQMILVEPGFSAP